MAPFAALRHSQRNCCVNTGIRSFTTTSPAHGKGSTRRMCPPSIDSDTTRDVRPFAMTVSNAPGHAKLAASVNASFSHTQTSLDLLLLALDAFSAAASLKKIEPAFPRGT